jgi:hypothetical protein
VGIYGVNVNAAAKDKHRLWLLKVQSLN